MCNSEFLASTVAGWSYRDSYIISYTPGMGPPIVYSTVHKSMKLTLSIYHGATCKFVHIYKKNKK